MKKTNWHWISNGSGKLLLFNTGPLRSPGSCRTEYKGDGLRPPCSRFKTNKYEIAIRYVGCSMLFVVFALFVKECKATS